MELAEALHLIEIGGPFVPFIFVIGLLIRQNSKKDVVIENLTTKVLALVETTRKVVDAKIEH